MEYGGILPNACGWIKPLVAPYEISQFLDHGILHFFPYHVDHLTFTVPCDNMVKIVINLNDGSNHWKAIDRYYA